ncbi:MAG TPA: hypothetical protein DGA22_10765 [Acidobacterium sp.]|nr:hypothetical protein [Acidobacterium sp.]
MEMIFAVAFAGKIGSGKTTISTAAARVLQCKRASFGDYVRHVVASQGLDATRENLQQIGTKHLEANRFEFCRNMLEYSGWTQGESIIIDGLRHHETIPLLNQLVAPAELRIAYIDIDELTRLKRIGIRDENQLASLRSADAHSSEQQVGTIIREIASLVLDGGQSVEDCVASALKWIREG